jgi:hypothetical protein
MACCNFNGCRRCAPENYDDIVKVDDDSTIIFKQNNKIKELEAEVENFITDEPRVKMLEDTVELLEKKLAEAEKFNVTVCTQLEDISKKLEKVKACNELHHEWFYKSEEKLKVAVEVLETHKFSTDEYVRKSSNEALKIVSEGV